MAPKELKNLTFRDLAIVLGIAVVPNGVGAGIGCRGQDKIADAVDALRIELHSVETTFAAAAQEMHDVKRRVEILETSRARSR